MKFFESWRIKRDITNFFLCGHSLGGYLCSVYTSKFPQQVKKLLLLSPVGYMQKPEDFDLKRVEVITVYDENGEKVRNKGPP